MNTVGTYESFLHLSISAKHPDFGADRSPVCPMAPFDSSLDCSDTPSTPLFLKRPLSENLPVTDCCPNPLGPLRLATEKQSNPVQSRPEATGLIMPIPRQALIAAITFDSLGLPEQYFGSPKLKGKIVGAKLMGRVLSLQSLLMSSLQLGSFSYAKTTCEAYTTIVIAQDGRYIALLFDPAAIATVTTSALCQWMRQLDALAVQRLWEQP